MAIMEGLLVEENLKAIVNYLHGFSINDQNTKVLKVINLRARYFLLREDRFYPKTKNEPRLDTKIAERAYTLRVPHDDIGN